MKDFNLNHLTYNQLLVEQDAAVIGTSYSIAVQKRLLELEKIELTNLQKETTNMNESSNLLSLLSDTDLESVYDALCDCNLYDSSGFAAVTAECNRRFAAKREKFAVSFGLTVFQVDQIKSLESNIELWGNKLAYLVPHRINELNNWKEQLTAIYDAARINLKLQASYAVESAPEVDAAPEVELTAVQPSMEELHTFTLVWYQNCGHTAVNSILNRYSIHAGYNIMGQTVTSFISTYTELYEITALLELIGLAPDDCIQAHSYS